jgi:hypothetical protein
MPLHEERRPLPGSGAPRISTGFEFSTTSLSGKVVTLRIEAVELARHLELDPARWSDAQIAFRIASGLADVTRSVATL